MAEDSNKFKKGMNQDVHPAEQYPQTYRSALNFVLLSQEGNIYAVTNENGTRLIDEVTLPPGKQIIGYDVLNTDIILILAGEDGSSQIGYIREDSSNLDPDYGYYHPVAPYDSNYDPSDPRNAFPEDNSEFGFSLSHPVDCVSRKLINGSRVLYYTDNLNPFGRVEFENPPEVGNVAEQSQLIFNQQIPVIDLKEIKEDVAGTLRPGVYQFITRYVTNNGGVTTFGIPTDMISVVPTDKDEGVNSYHGAYYNDTTVNKNIVLSISGVDTNYQELEIIVAYYEGGTTFSARSVANIPITSDSLEYTFTGPDTGEEIALTREELRQVPISYKRAKCIEQKDNTLFLSNLSDDAIDNQALQQVANHMSVEYQIREKLYSGREGDGSAPISNILQVLSIELQGQDQVLVTFTQEVGFTSFTAGTNNVISPGSSADYGGLDHVLTKNGEPAIGKVDHTATVAGDTVELDGEVFNAVAPGGIIDPLFDFEVDPNPDNTASNLVIAVNNDDSRNFAATLVDDSGIKTQFVWKGVGGDGEVITYTGTITGDATLSGESTTVTEYPATNMQKVSPTEILYTFTGPTQISEADTIFSLDIYDAAFEQSVSPSGNIEVGANEPPESTSDSADQGFTDFIDEQVGFDNRSYRRGEVYSLGFMLLFKDGTTSFVYHIPGGDKTLTTVGKEYPDLGGSTYRSGDTTGPLGTYVSDNEYPLDQFYPGNDSGDENISPSRNIRHHVMPTLEQEPHFRDLGGGNAYIRTLGLKFTIDPAYDIPEGLKESIQEIVFVRERRNLDINKSVLSQGIVNQMVETADHCNNDGSISGTSTDNVRADYCLQEVPFFGNLLYATNAGQSRIQSSGHSYRGVCYPGLSGAEGTFGGTPTFDNGEKLNTDLRGNRGFFHSPESILTVDTGTTVDELTSAVIKPWLLMEGTATTVAKAKCQYKGARGEDWCKYYGFQDMHGTYTSYDSSYNYTTNNDRVIGGAAERAPGIRRHTAIQPDNAVPNKTTTRWTQGGWEIFVTNQNAGVPIYDPDNPYEVAHYFPDPGGDKYYLYHEVRNWDKAQACLNDCNKEAEAGEVRRVGDDLSLDLNTTTDIKNYLYNIEVVNNTQYGQLTTATFIPIGRAELQLAGSEYGDFFSGDTYITKFSVNTGGLFWYYPYLRDKGASINRPFETSSRRGYGHVTDGPEGDTALIAEGYDFRACHYFFVESDANTYYRHRPEDEERQDYFPNESNTSTNLDNFFAWAGNITAYNGLYSFENNLKEFFVRGSTQQVVTDFENRTIYSEQAYSDSVVDAYRSFLVNNYYDLPSSKGPIWDTFVHANTLYMHTPKSCWRTFAEPAATLSGGNISDVVLGTGSLFARPSTEVQVTKGGFAGTISQYGGIHTSIGYIFPDVLQGKVFLLGVGAGGPQLTDLTLQGTYTFAHKNMDVGITRDPVTGQVNMSNVTTTNSYLIDNPYQGIGFMGGYDRKLKRAWIVKQGQYGFNMSYSPLMEAWSSYHSYAPNVIIPFDNRVFFFQNGDQSAWEMNIGEKGNFFGQIYDSELEMSVPTGLEGSFTNQILHGEFTDVNGRKVRDDFFDTLQVYTDRHNTGILEFVPGNTFAPTKTDGQVFYKFRQDQYRLAIPRDSVVDNGGDIFDPDNIYQPQGGNVPIDNDYTVRERIKGDYAIFKYTYDNASGNSFVLRELRTIFELNHR